MNILTEAEKTNGWEFLFDGHTTAGWHNFQKQNIQGWLVQDGNLTTPGNQGDIVSERHFEDFELSIEWRIQAQGNSGIFFYVQEDSQYGKIWHTGPEYQLIDDHNYHVPLKETQKSGANYDMQAPATLAAKEPGVWNQARLLVNKGHVEHWLNGEKVITYDFDSPDWQQQLGASKFASFDYAKKRKGAIALQDHGDPVAFRNIKIRKL